MMNFAIDYLLKGRSVAVSNIRQVLGCVLVLFGCLFSSCFFFQSSTENIEYLEELLGEKYNFAEFRDVLFNS